SSAVFRRHVSDGSPIGERQFTQSRTKVFNKFSDDAMLAQHFRDRQNQISSRSSFPQTPVSFTPTTCGISIETGCPSIAASASIPPTPHPKTPSPLIIVV